MTSTVPAAINGLLSVGQAAVTNADVFAGPPTTADYADWLGIAYSPSGGEIVIADLTWAQLGAQRHEETYDVVCTIGYASGDIDGVAGRARAYGILDAFAAGIATNYTLAGAVRIAHVSGHALVTEVDEDGLSEVLRVTVNITARI